MKTEKEIRDRLEMFISKFLERKSTRKPYQITHTHLQDLIKRSIDFGQEFINLGLTPVYRKMDEVTDILGWEAEKVLLGRHLFTELVCPHEYADFDACPDCCH